MEETVEMTRLYEALRAQVLRESPVGVAPVGLAVLRHRGMAGWMAMEARAKADCGLDPGGQSEEAARRSSPSPPPTRELVRLLVGAALLTMTGRDS